MEASRSLFIILLLRSWRIMPVPGPRDDGPATNIKPVPFSLSFSLPSPDSRHAVETSKVPAEAGSVIMVFII